MRCATPMPRRSLPPAFDVVAISRRLGLNTYGHLFKRDDSAAAAAIDAVLR